METFNRTLPITWVSQITMKRHLSVFILLMLNHIKVLPTFLWFPVASEESEHCEWIAVFGKTDFRKEEPVCSVLSCRHYPLSLSCRRDTVDFPYHFHIASVYELKKSYKTSITNFASRRFLFFMNWGNVTINLCKPSTTHVAYKKASFLHELWQCVYLIQIFTRRCENWINKNVIK